ncbi:MAG TPA: cytochrome b/b6 domain-containing protein [Nevskiaceae bacterium]|nr:cytochrome b/b6 domain-containing protein [Nevskiaceae bacterium]
MSKDPVTLLRHRAGVRVLHGINALAVIVLLVTGLALGEVLASGWVALLGGHLRVNAIHRGLGLAFAVAWLLIVCVQPRRIGRLLRDTLRFQCGDGRWFVEFPRFCLTPRRWPAPFHAGRFDPAQRVVFLLLVVAVVVVSLTGVYMYWEPRWGRLMFVLMIRAHIVAAWTLIGCLCLHVAAGCGLLPSHRGLVTAMFGDGRVRLTRAQALWPGWAARQTAGEPPRHEAKRSKVDRRR